MAAGRRERSGGVTSIEWTDRTWNPVRGCTRVSEGCRHCYAEAFAARNMPGHRSPTTGDPFAVRAHGAARWTGRVELIPSKLDEPLHWRKPLRVFVNSMSDLFHESLPDEAIAAVFGVMAAAPQHTFQILTKRADRLPRWFEWVNTQPCDPGTGGGDRHPFGVISWAATLEGVAGVSVRDLYERRGGGPAPWPLPNVWLGVSVEDQATADERIPLLLQTPAATRFVSYEPALGPVDFSAWIARVDHCIACGAEHLPQNPDRCPACAHEGCLISTWGDRQAQLHRDNERDPSLPDHDGPALHWVIVGGESGPGARPFDVAWARSTVEQCKAAGVAVFVKQLGARPVEFGRIPLADRKGGDPSEWPEDLRVREMPR
jgi:protein gp37